MHHNPVQNILFTQNSSCTHLHSILLLPPKVGNHWSFCLPNFDFSRNVLSVNIISSLCIWLFHLASYFWGMSMLLHKSHLFITEDYPTIWILHMLSIRSLVDAHRNISSILPSWNMLLDLTYMWNLKMLNTVHRKRG